MANFPGKMEYPAEFLRGWPVDGGIELSLPIAASTTISVGQTVTLNSSGEVRLPAADAATGFAICVRGNGDDKSVAVSNKAIVLFGHYIVKLSTDLLAAAIGTYAVGDVVGAEATTGKWKEQSGGAGQVIEVGTDYIIVVVR